MLIRTGIAAGITLSSLLLAPLVGLSAETSGARLIEPTTGSFPDPSLKQWIEHSFVGNTKYEIVDAGAEKVLKGSADGTASVLYTEQKVDVAKTPWVNWSWQVENTLGPIKEQTKAGDDFPGRLYLVVRTGFLPWETTVVNYVWSSTSEAGTHWFSPCTANSVMIALRSGDKDIGQWQHERRNVVDDFKTFFDLDIDKLDAYAVMVDADNSGKRATAYFGNISFSAD